MLSKDLRNEKISFSWGYPDLVNFPLEEYREVTTAIKAADLQDIFQYHPGQGIMKLRQEIIDAKMGDFGKCSPNEIIITPGEHSGA